MKEGKQRDENGLDSVFCVCVFLFWTSNDFTPN